MNAAVVAKRLPPAMPSRDCLNHKKLKTHRHTSWHYQRYSAIQKQLDQQELSKSATITML